MRRVWLTLFFGLVIASPGFCQYVGPGSSLQPAAPSAPPATDQPVVGTYVIKTDGSSGEYSLAPKIPNTTRIEEEHSEWHLTYRNIGGASCLHTDVVKWQHTTTTYQKSSDGSRVLHTTITTQKVVQGKSPSAPLQPNPCYLTATETYPLDGPATLAITGYTPFTTPGYHTKYRALALSSGSSLPNIMVETTTTVDGVPLNNPPTQILTASLEIQRWDKAEWSTPYAGQVTATNDYAAYTIPEGYEWLTIHASWNTQPK